MKLIVCHILWEIVRYDSYKYAVFPTLDETVGNYDS